MKNATYLHFWGYFLWREWYYYWNLGLTNLGTQNVCSQQYHLIISIKLSTWIVGLKIKPSIKFSRCKEHCLGCKNGLCDKGCHLGWKGDYCDKRYSYIKRPSIFNISLDLFNRWYKIIYFKYCFFNIVKTIHMDVIAEKFAETVWIWNNVTILTARVWKVAILDFKERNLKVLSLIWFS